MVNSESALPADPITSLKRSLTSERATTAGQMAPGRPCTAVGLSHCNDYRETNPLKLGAEHVPFPCSLRELVLDRYAEPPGMGSNAHPMQLDELLEYLKSIDNFNLSPWVAIVGQTEAIGDPATPSREQSRYSALAGQGPGDLGKAVSTGGSSRGPGSPSQAAVGCACHHGSQVHATRHPSPASVTG